MLSVFASPSVLAGVNAVAQSDRCKIGTGPIGLRRSTLRIDVLPLGTVSERLPCNWMRCGLVGKQLETSK
jgi:hypothetical protein